MESLTEKNGKPNLKEIKKIAKQTGNDELLKDVKKRMESNEKIKK